MNRLSSVIVLCLLVIMLGCSTTSTRNGLRVHSLGVEEGVQKYYADNVEIVAFAPGSGWVRMKARDGFGPIISLNDVSSEDIEKFNRFSQSLGSPIRAKLMGDTLSVVLEQEEIDYLVAKYNVSEAALRLVTEQIHWRSEDLPRLAIHRDGDGRVFLVDEKSSTQFAVK